MQQRAVILKRYLDAKVDRETQALFALQALVHRLEHPNSKYTSLVKTLFFNIKKIFFLVLPHSSICSIFLVF